LPILVNLSQDPSLYVRKSVANHLNDVSKDHPEWLLEMLANWPQNHPHTTWITKRALRTLVKSGHPRAFSRVGATEEVAVAIKRFVVSPTCLSLGDRLTLSVEMQSQSAESQQLVVDYRVHYVKKSGSTSPKVFKMKGLTLEPQAEISFKRLQLIKDFSTRTHNPGQHLVELLVNGKCLARSSFEIVE
jgi:hypothetical protein